MAGIDAVSIVSTLAKSYLASIPTIILEHLARDRTSPDMHPDGTQMPWDVA